MSWPALWVLAWGVLAWGALACKEAPPEPSKSDEDGGLDACADDLLGPRLLRRLTKREFERNVVDAFA